MQYDSTARACAVDAGPRTKAWFESRSMEDDDEGEFCSRLNRSLWLIRKELVYIRHGTTAATAAHCTAEGGLSMDLDAARDWGAHEADCAGGAGG